MISVQKLHSAAITRNSRIFYSQQEKPSWRTGIDLNYLCGLLGAVNGDVVIFADGFMFTCGIFILRKIFARKSLLIVIDYDANWTSENTIRNLSFYTFIQSKLSLTVNCKKSDERCTLADELAGCCSYETKLIELQQHEIFAHLCGQVDELFRIYVEICKKFKVNWHLFSKNNCVFDNSRPTIHTFNEDELEYELEKRKIRHYILMDICIALSPLELPNYVILEIIDWIDYLYYDGHKEKISLIEGIEKSIRKIKDSKLDE